MCTSLWTPQWQGHLMTGQRYRKSQWRNRVGLHSFSPWREVPVSIHFEKLSCTKFLLAIGRNYHLFFGVDFSHRKSFWKCKLIAKVLVILGENVDSWPSSPLFLNVIHELIAEIYNKNNQRTIILFFKTTGYKAFQQSGFLLFHNFHSRISPYTLFIPPAQPSYSYLIFSPTFSDSSYPLKGILFKQCRLVV